MAKKGKKANLKQRVCLAAGLTSLVAPVAVSAMDYQNQVRDPANYELMAESKHERGVHELDSFQYFSEKRGEENTIVMWDDGTFTMGLYPFNLKAFYEDEAMAPELNEIVRNKLEEWLKQSEQVSQSTSKQKDYSKALEREIELSLGLPEDHLRGTYPTSLPTTPGTSTGRQRLVEAIIQEDAKERLTSHLKTTFAKEDAQITQLASVNPLTGLPYEDWEIPYNQLATSTKPTQVFGRELDKPTTGESYIDVYEAGKPVERIMLPVEKTIPKESTIEETLREVRAFQKAEAHPGQFAFRVEGLGTPKYNGQDRGEFRVGLGTSWEPSDYFGMNATLSAGAFDKAILEEITTEPSPRGIYGHGIIEQEKPGFSGAVALDIKFGLPNVKFVLGGGVNYRSWIESITEEILRNETIIKSSKNSISNSETSLELRGGLEISPKPNGFGFGVMGTYNPKKKQGSVGGFVSIPLNRTQNK